MSKNEDKHEKIKYNNDEPCENIKYSAQNFK